MDVVVCLVIVIVLLWVVCFVEVLTSESQVLPWVLVLLLAVTVVTVVKVRYVWMCVCVVTACFLVSACFCIPQWSLDLPICLVLSVTPCLAEVVVLL